MLSIYRMVKKKVEYSESSESEEEEIKQVPKKKTPNKVDKRAESSRLNAAKARETKLKKMREEKQKVKVEQHAKIEAALQKPLIAHPVEPNQPSLEESDDEEILIINPPPIDEQKMQRKQMQYQHIQEMYEWIQNEKSRKANKTKPLPPSIQPQPPIEPIVQPPIQPPQPVEKIISEEEKILRDAFLQKCGVTPQIKF